MTQKTSFETTPPRQILLSPSRAIHIPLKLYNRSSAADISSHIGGKRNHLSYHADSRPAVLEAFVTLQLLIRVLRRSRSQSQWSWPSRFSPSNSSIEIHRKAHVFLAYTHRSAFLVNSSLFRHRSGAASRFSISTKGTGNKLRTEKRSIYEHRPQGFDHNERTLRKI